MRRATKTAAGVLAIAATLVPPAASAASFDCNARGLSRAEGMICEDPQLSRPDEQLARRGRCHRPAHELWPISRPPALAGGVGWQRDLCGADRACIDAHYRAQARFLDRLQQCLDTRYARRACLRERSRGTAKRCAR